MRFYRLVIPYHYFLVNVLPPQKQWFENVGILVRGACWYKSGVVVLVLVLHCIGEWCVVTMPPKNLSKKKPYSF